jgi:hypothetical protein
MSRKTKESSVTTYCFNSVKLEILYEAYIVVINQVLLIRKR